MARVLLDCDQAHNFNGNMEEILMFKALKYSAIIFIILVSITQTSFAITTFPASFYDSDVTPTKLADGSWTWTHILTNTEFTPNLAAGDTINVTDALLSIQMDFLRSGTGNTKLFEITGEGDSILLATLENDGSAGTVNNFVWNITLDSTILPNLNDKSFAVSLSVVADRGSIKNVDSSILQGNAIVTDPPPAQPSVPEPSTFLLLGAGLLGFGLSRKRMKR